MKEIGTRISICAAGASRAIIIGGHSASGQAAVDSFPALDFTPDGFTGLDPFDEHNNRGEEDYLEFNCLFGPVYFNFNRRCHNFLQLLMYFTHSSCIRNMMLNDCL